MLPYVSVILNTLAYRAVSKINIRVMYVHIYFVAAGVGIKE